MAPLFLGQEQARPGAAVNKSGALTSSWARLGSLSVLPQFPLGSVPGAVLMGGLSPRR